MPVILRPLDEYFKVVGEAYIHGVMYGEAMEWPDARKWKLENFTLA